MQGLGRHIILQVLPRNLKYDINVKSQVHPVIVFKSDDL